MDYRYEILRVDDCPSWQEGEINLKRAMSRLGLEGKIEIQVVQNDITAEKEAFSGSPMFRVNGLDLFPSPNEGHSLRCRVFRVGDKFSGWPSEEMLVEAMNNLSIRKPGHAQNE